MGEASGGAATEAASAPVLLGATAPVASAVAMPVAKAEVPPQQVMPPGVPAGSAEVPEKYAGTMTHGAVCLGCVCCCPCSPLLYACPLDQRTVYRAPDGSEYDQNGARTKLSHEETKKAEQAGKDLYKGSKHLGKAMEIGA